MHKAPCGFDCERCPVFIATLKRDNELKVKLVKKYSTSDNPLTVNDMECHGCLASDQVFSYCQECEIRRAYIDNMEE